MNSSEDILGFVATEAVQAISTPDPFMKTPDPAPAPKPNPPTGDVMPLIQGKSIIEYLEAQFPATTGHLPLRNWIHRVSAMLSWKSEAETRLAEVTATQPINTHVRLFDLVRFMRSELHRSELITDEEYSWLCHGSPMATSPEGGSPSPRRLEDYDAFRNKLHAELLIARAAADALRTSLASVTAERDEARAKMDAVQREGESWQAHVFWARHKARVALLFAQGHSCDFRAACESFMHKTEGAEALLTSARAEAAALRTSRDAALARVGQLESAKEGRRE